MKKIFLLATLLLVFMTASAQTENRTGTQTPQSTQKKADATTQDDRNNSTMTPEQRKDKKSKKSKTKTDKTRNSDGTTRNTSDPRTEMDQNGLENNTPSGTTSPSGTTLPPGSGNSTR